MKNDEYQSPLNRALHFLTHRPRSISEVEARLNRYGFPREVVEETITKLKSTGLLDDLTFAKWWVEARANKKSRRALIYELTNKNVDKDTILLALTSQDDLSSLRQLIQKKSTLSEQKLIRYAIARGYRYDDIKSSLRNLGSEC